MADYSSKDQIPDVPDDLTLPQFIFDYKLPDWPSRSTTALIDDETGRRTTFDALKSRTWSLAAGLLNEYRIGPQDIVMLVSPNQSDFPVVIWAVHRLGGSVTFSNPMSTAEELEYQLTQAGVTFMIAHSSALNAAMQAASAVGLPLTRMALLDDVQDKQNMRTIEELVKTGLDAGVVISEHKLIPGESKRKIAFLCWSSGTTGKPKAVAISHAAFISNLIQMAVHNEIDRPFQLRESTVHQSGDVMLGALPFFHAAGLVCCLHFAIICGNSLVVIQKFQIHSMLESIGRHKISHLLLVPPLALAITQHLNQLPEPFDHAQVRYIIVGAAPLSREIEAKLCDSFPRALVGQVYGMTEMTCCVTMANPRRPTSPGSCGWLLPGIRARVVRDDGTLAAFGEKGEIVIQGPSLALGYFRNPKATAEVFKKGWIHTGDEGILTTEGEVYVSDRLKELIKVRGFQVAPAELEDCLLGHPDVQDACVVGLPDDYSGEVPVAYVVLSKAASEHLNRNPNMAAVYSESISKHVATRKVAYKHLAGGVQFTSVIPKNGSGKILRRILREHARKTVPKLGRYRDKAKL